MMVYGSLDNFLKTDQGSEDSYDFVIKKTFVP